MVCGCKWPGVSGRNDLMAHNLPYAHDHVQLNFIDAIGAIKPHVLIGATELRGHLKKK